jgi:hypothetical protein
MKRFLVIVLFYSSLMFAQLQGPKIFLPADTYNFGTVKESEVVKHTFPIVNKGDDTLKITGVYPSCGCTAFDLPKKELAPGETVLLTAIFNTSGKSGSQSKVISIGSNDKSSSMVRVFLKGSVSTDTATVTHKLPKLVVPESQFDFGSAKEGDVLTHSFQLVNEGTDDLNILDVKTSCGCTAALPSTKVLKPKESGSVSVEFNTANRSGKVVRTITVTTDDPETPSKVLTISADIAKREN